MANTWNADQSNAGGAAGVEVSTLIMPAYRIAGITTRAMIVPSVDMYAEAIPELNRLLGSWNLDGHRIYTTSINSFALTVGQKTYTIGPGAEFDMARPLEIRYANLLYPTTPVVRRPVRILSDSEWASIAVQDLSGAPPFQLYYDGSYSADGQATISLRFQPPAGYTLELYSWLTLHSAFVSQTDVAVFPPGYEHALVYNLAKGLAALNPGMAKMSRDAYAEAARSLAVIASYNSSAPKMDTEPGLSREVGPGYGWLDGGIR